MAMKPVIIAAIAVACVVVAVGIFLAIYLPLTLKKKTSSGAKSDTTVKLQVSNTGLTALPGAVVGTETPSYFGMKFVAAYLAEDINPDFSNKGQTSMIYLNPQCNDDIGNCGVNPSEDTVLIQDYFDFSLPSDQVNAQLGSQSRAVQPGTYKYARLEFCKNGTDGNPNIQFLAAGMSGAHSYARNSCAVTVAINPPLVVERGDKIELTLAYDLENAVVINDTYSGSAECTNSTPSYCMGVPEFVPIVSKVVSS